VVSTAPWYHRQEFVDGPTAWSAASLAITRAGRSTIADAGFHGVPLILVPLPSASEDHQTKNAQAVVAGGAGILVPQASLEAEAASNPAAPSALTLPDSLVAAMLLCLEPARQMALAKAATASSPAGAAQRLASLVLAVV
jgi:UDP-N-acetylglucosamine--N-acetylmuramyl-(pentapeptide) pyrophosphoryl-undecaprenol N-acetylglucosamine transferase